MRLLIIKNIECEGPGLIEDILMEHKANYDVMLANGRLKYPNLRKYDRFIVLGGPQSANDKTSMIKKELDFIKKIIKLNKPYLGICLGAQLLAKSLGAEVKINKAKELGNYTIKLTREGQADALFNGLSTKLNVFQWHGETFDIPRDAVKLAYCRSCANQAFKYKNSYGIQFHLEITPEMLKTWLQIPEYRVELNHQGLHVFEIAQDFAKNYSSYRKNCRILINNYLNSAENELAS